MISQSSHSARSLAGLAFGVGAFAAILLLLGNIPAAVAADKSSGFATGDWPFRPLQRPAVPTVRDSSWLVNPIDSFVLAKLEKKGIKPSRAADKLVLLRRVTYDLTGLPPTPEEQAAFLADTSADAYAKVVDRLLASPRYGERWAEHWLDVVRFADTDGFKNDWLRPDAHKYRDYVIQALNADMPYDRFIREQLAGDELEPGNPQALIATGLNRLYPDELNASDLVARRQEYLNDLTDVTGAAFLGLTLGCARCHDHKFDPITQADYYRFQAIFAPMLPRDDLVAATPAEQRQYQQREAAWEHATKAIRTEIDVLTATARDSIIRDAIAPLDARTQQAWSTPPERRTPLDKQLVVQAEKWVNFKLQKLANHLSDADSKRYTQLQGKLSELDALKPLPLPTAMAVVDVGSNAPRTFRLGGGDMHQPREEVHPGFPVFLGLSEPEIPHVLPPNTTGRRAALAEWLCRPDHPLTARVMMNRLWSHHFGEGIVGTPNDFGTMGDSPTHPELLDWLAAEFVARGWSMKAMHRLMVMSATYRQTSFYDPQNPAQAKAHGLDSADHFLWRARRTRLEGEAIRDATLQVAGDLNLRMFGPSAKPELPEGLTSSAWEPDPIAADRNRRSVYVLAKRNLRYPLLEAFDEPDLHNSCPRRSQTVTPPQALALLNGRFAETEAQHWAAQLVARCGKDQTALVQSAYAEAFARQPSADELAAAAAFLSAESPEPAGAMPDGAPGAAAAKNSNRKVSKSRTAAAAKAALTKSVADFCHALLNSNEFLYVD